MRSAIILVVGLVLIWLPMLLFDDQNASSVAIASNLLASVGLFLLLALLGRLKRGRK